MNQKLQILQAQTLYSRGAETYKEENNQLKISDL
jgi:hypothetical protein